VLPGVAASEFLLLLPPAVLAQTLRSGMLHDFTALPPVAVAAVVACRLADQQIVGVLTNNQEVQRLAIGVMPSCYLRLYVSDLSHLKCCRGATG